MTDVKKICENCEDFRDLPAYRKSFTKGHCTGHRRGSVVNAADTCKFYTPKIREMETITSL